MNSRTSLRTNRLVTLATAAAILASATAALAQAAPPPTPPATTTAPATGPATQPVAMPTTAPFSFPDITAVINNQVLRRDDFQLYLEQVAAQRVFERILEMAVARQACEAGNIKIGQKQIEAQRDRVLDSLKEQGVPADKLQQALATVIARQGLTPVEFDMLMTRNACLAAIANNDPGAWAVKETEVDEALKIETGIKYLVVDTLLQDPAMAAKLRQLVEKDGKTIAEAGNELQCRQQEITISQYAVETEGPAKTVLELAKKLDEHKLSAMVNVNGANHMIYMEKIIPAQNLNAAAMAALRAKLKDRMIQASQDRWGNNHLQKLLAQARVDVKDPILQQIYAQIRAAQEAAATRAAAATSTAPATVTTAPVPAPAPAPK